LNESSNTTGLRRLTERQVAAELGIDRLEVYLLAAEQRVGRYDPASHVLLFSEAEVDTLAARLSVTRCRQKEVSQSTREKIPEPNRE